MVSKITFVVVFLAAMVQIAYSDDDSWSYSWNTNDDDGVADQIREHQEGVEDREADLEPRDNDDGEVISHSNSFSWSVDENGKKTEKHEGEIARKTPDGKIIKEHYKH